MYNRGLQKGHNVYTTEGVQARRIFTVQKASLNAMVYSFLATFDALTRDCDVIHYHAIGPSVPLVIAKLFGKHTVCTVHGLNWKVDKWGGFASAYLKLGERVAAKYADDLVVLSESEWNYFQEKYDRTAILIPNAVQMRQPLPCNLIREKYGLEAGSYILYVGRISPEKGPLDLVTARGDPVDRILGLELGADDYVPKPCSPRELVARIRAILRRVAGNENNRGPVQVGKLQIDLAQRRAHYDGKQIPLTGTELSLLEMLARSAGQPVPKAEIYPRILGRPMGRYDRAIDVHMTTHTLAMRRLSTSFFSSSMAMKRSRMWGIPK